MPCKGGVLALHRQPRQEQTVRLDVFPVGHEATGNLAAIAPQQAFQFLAREPFLPLRSVQAAPVFGVLIDNRDAPAGLYHAADFAYRLCDLHRMFQALGGVGAVEEAILEGQFGHGAGAGVNPGGDIAQHFLGDVQAPQFGARFLFLEDARETALAAAHVQHPPAGQIAQMIVDQLDVIDARIDGRRKVLLVARGFVERGLDAGAQLRGELRVGLSGKEPPPVQFEAFLDFAQRAQRKTSEVRPDAPRSTIMPRSLLRLPLRPLRSLRETIRSLPGFRAKSAKNAKKNLRGSPGCATIHHHATIPSSPPFAPIALFARNNSKPSWISRKERKERKEKPPRFAGMRHDPPSCHDPFFASLCALCALCAKQFEAFLDFAQRAQRKTSEVRPDASRSTIMPRSLLRLPLRPLRSLRETIRSLPGFRAKSARNAKKNLRGSPGCATIHHHATIPSSPPFAPFALFARNNSKPFWISRKERKERKEKPPRFAGMRHDPPSCHDPFFASLCALCALCAKQFEAFLDFAQRAQRTQRKTSEVRRDAPRSTIMPRSLLRLPLRPLRSLRETIRSLPGFRAKSAKKN